MFPTILCETFVKSNNCSHVVGKWGLKPGGASPFLKCLSREFKVGETRVTW